MFVRPRKEDTRGRREKEHKAEEPLSLLLTGEENSCPGLGAALVKVCLAIPAWSGDRGDLQSYLLVPHLGSFV